MDRILRKAIAGTMALLLAAAVTGCSRREKTPAPAPEQNQASEAEEVKLEPAEPAVGVGRVMPAVVVKKNRTICIDPGHGFYDNGTGEASYFPEGVYEKHVTLAIANFLNQDLIDRGFDTIMTHNGVDVPEYDWDGNWIFNPNERIAFINAHGTGTPTNDASESAALNRVFGAQLPPVSSTKSYTGHTTSASGSIEAAFCLMALWNGFIPVQPEFENPDEQCIIPVSGSEALSVDLHHVMCNAFGFEGNDSSIILSRYE